MNPLQYYISRYDKKKIKMWNVISRASSGQFMNIDNNFRSLISMKIIEQHFSSREITNNMCVIDCPISLQPIMTLLQRGILPVEYFNDMLGGTAVGCNASNEVSTAHHAGANDDTHTYMQKYTNRTYALRGP